MRGKREREHFKPVDNNSEREKNKKIKGETGNIHNFSG